MYTAIIISILSLIVSFFALIVSFMTSRKANSIAMGEIEISVHESIRNSQARVSQITADMSNLLFKEVQSEGDKNQIEVYEKIFNQAIEDNLNCYDQACGKYIDKKIDVDRFKKDYQTAIRRLVKETPTLSNYFDRNTTNYNKIIKVFDEWENLER